MKNNEENKQEICILLRQIKKLQRKSNLPISSMEPTSSMLKVLTEKWKIFFFVVLVRVSNIIRLFLKLLNTKPCTELNASNPTSSSLHWKFTSNSLWIHFELNFKFTLNSLFQIHFIGNKTSEINKVFALKFLLKLFLLFWFVCLLKI